MMLGAMPDDFDVLPRRMEDLQHLLVRHQLEERREVDAFGERIDHDGLVRARNLGDAQDREIGRLAQKFGVDGNEIVFGEPGAGGGQFLGGRDRLHEGFLSESRSLSRTVRGRRGSIGGGFGGITK